MSVWLTPCTWNYEVLNPEQYLGQVPSLISECQSASCPMKKDHFSHKYRAVVSKIAHWAWLYNYGHQVMLFFPPFIPHGLNSSMFEDVNCKT